MPCNLYLKYIRIRMRKLTKKEEMIMKLFWKNGGMFVKDLIPLLPESRPHFNTVSTQVRMLEKDGFLSHDKSYGGSFRYYPLVTEEGYKESSLTGLISGWFGNSYMSAVSTLLRDEKITVDELKELIRQVEEKKAE